MRLASRALHRATRLRPVRSLLWRRHAALARRSGLDRFHVLLSFDCDTDRDVEVIGGVVDRLAAFGISATFAVPGEQLRRGRTVYRRLFDVGHEFIAHGDREHCVLRDGAFVSTFFYDRAERAAVMEDIERATATFGDVLGRAPAGFRVPHFGTFQAPADLSFLHASLRRLGYRFSSSTLPLYGLIHGPVHRSADGFAEIPVSGRFSAPLAVLDPFGFRYATGPRPPAERYGEEFADVVRFFTTRRLPGLLNTYADPSQVHDFPAFWRAIELVASLRVPTLSYSRLLGLAR
ncbi:MAG: polysaccharide deacetylase family protein [Elusimicrobia bacterium]|nr:polysaccharide deacetylase family protein [Elusimicrobiota bacterium]